MQYVALLRGINVGGNNIIKMSDLKAACEKMGLKNVRTFIQSGNVIFESDETSSTKVTELLEKNLSKVFDYKSRVIIRTEKQYKKIIVEVPSSWAKRADIRCYVLFIAAPLTAVDVSKEIELRDDVDSMKEGTDVIYITTLLSGITKSKLNKIIAKKIYKEITIRNYNTTKKISELLAK